MVGPPVDDVWGDSGDEADGSAELKREWDVRREGFYSTGYREGVEVGKESSLQAGFDKGFAAGAMAGHQWGMLTAASKTLKIFSSKLSSQPGSDAKVEALAAILDVPPKVAMQQLCQNAHSTAVQAGEEALRPLAAALAAPAAPAAAGVDLVAIRKEATQKLEELGFTVPSASSPARQ